MNSQATSSLIALRLARKLAVFGVFFTLTVLLAGAWTRLVDAGLGCPDWPGCYGAWVVPDAERAAAFAPEAPLEAPKAWMEMLHRYLATSLGILVVVLAGLAWKQRQVSGYPLGLSLLLLLVVCIQGAFGAWTVTLQLWPQVVTLHLLGGFTLLGLFFWLYLRLAALEKGQPSPSSPSWLWWGVFVLLLLQVALGGWTSSNYAGLACSGFPTCNGSWWPAADFSEALHITQGVGPNYLHGQLHAPARTGIHWLHRLGALLLLLGCVALLLRYRFQPQVRGSLLLLFLALGTQVALGVANVLWLLPLTLAWAHTAGAALFLLVFLRLGWQLGGLPLSGSQRWEVRHA
ncbi:COX15/CtaA family protein [Marinospirillum perlucidum]|uniref:COX15/CtaA family protein n=1 Tax=Marinospirillum perlucidum TaxID=1982602 RepID=UPI000DF3F6CA|nr:COX15/CtaA family protein [Marinospirillum perlucidum]